MGKVRNADIRQYNALKQWLGYRVDLKAYLSMSRLKRVVNGRHWLDDFIVYYENFHGSIKRHTRSDLNKLNRKRTRKHRKAIEMFYGHIINPKITHYDKRKNSEIITEIFRK